MIKKQDWYEDPEHPGSLRPVGEPIPLKHGDSITLTTEMIDGVTMPWGESTVTRGPKKAEIKETP